jgi:hypothetical protein
MDIKDDYRYPCCRGVFLQTPVILLFLFNVALRQYCSHTLPWYLHYGYIALVFKCDLRHYLTFPQLCREILAFLAIYFILFCPLPFTHKS